MNNLKGNNLKGNDYYMDNNVIVSTLKKQRDRLDSAIAALSGEADPHKRGRRPKVQSIDAGRQTTGSTNTGNTTSNTNTGSGSTGRKRVLSAAARQRMSEAAKKRWAEAKQGNNVSTGRGKKAA